MLLQYFHCSSSENLDIFFDFFENEEHCWITARRWFPEKLILFIDFGSASVVYWLLSSNLGICLFLTSWYLTVSCSIRIITKWYHIVSVDSLKTRNNVSIQILFFIDANTFDWKLFQLIVFRTLILVVPITLYCFALIKFLL